MTAEETAPVQLSLEIEEQTNETGGLPPRPGDDRADSPEVEEGTDVAEPDDVEEPGEEATVVMSFDDGPPTEIMTVPKPEPVEERVNDPILDDDFDRDIQDPEQVEAPESAPPVRREPIESAPRESWFERVRTSAAAQLALLCFVGLLVAVYLFDAPGGDEEVQRGTEPRGSFPTLEIEGAPRVTEKDIERRLRMAPPAAVDSSDEKIRRELKEIAALGRKAAGVDPLPERQAPGRRHGRRRGEAENVNGSVGGEAKRREAAKVMARRFYAPGGTVKIEGADETEERNLLPLPVGARLHAKLEVGISSGHPTPVLARLTKEVRAEGRLVAPKGSMLKGRFVADGDKVYATFAELLLDGGESLAFEGYAVEQKVPGFAATRREIGDGDPGGTIVQDTMEVAKGVVRSVTSGSIVGQVAQGVADGVLPEQQAAKPSKVVLEVAAGKRFQIVVTKGGRT